MHILIADDDQQFRERLARALRCRGHEVGDVENGLLALEYAKSHPIDAAILDLRMPKMEGLACLAKLILLAPKAAIIILTGYGSIATAMEAVRLGAKDYLTKPTDVARILEILQRDDILDGGEIRADPEPPTLERVEWEHIQRILTDCDGNISEAARLLGMHRRSLQRKLQKYPPTR
jgi:two-component system response regulator RegA